MRARARRAHIRTTVPLPRPGMQKQQQYRVPEAAKLTLSAALQTRRLVLSAEAVRDICPGHQGLLGTGSMEGCQQEVFNPFSNGSQAGLEQPSDEMQTAIEPSSPGSQGSGLDDCPHVQTIVYKLPAFDKEPAAPEQVVHFLVSHGYLLTALELLVEAESAEIESDKPILELLGPFFNNPGHFPPEEIEKCSGDTEFKLSAQLAEREQRLEFMEEKAATSEYELRIAREDVDALQMRLEKASPSSAAEDKSGGTDLTAEGEHPKAQLCPMVPADRNELNSSVKSYLGASGFRLSALTFDDEAAGKFANKVPKAGTEALIKYYQAFQEADGLRETIADAEGKCAELQALVDQAAADAAELRTAINTLETENKCLQGDIQLLNEQLQAMQAASSTGAGQCGDAAGAEGFQVSTRAAADVTYLRPGSTMHAVEALRVVADTLPKIVPSILINAREDLLPIFTAVIQEHPDASARCALSKTLFNMIKKPDHAQRQMIINGCKELAGRIGAKRTMDELLPQCWEQLNDKYPERRVLVAESCGHLAPYVTQDIRQALMLGMLGQLADDSKAAVRASVSSNLAALLPHLEGIEKYSQVEELCFQLCMDGSDEVQASALEVLLPALVEWSRDSGEVPSSLLPGILARMRDVLETTPAVTGLPELSSSLSKLHIVGPVQQDQLRMLLRMWMYLMPEFRAQALLSAPSWARANFAGNEAVEGPHSSSSVSAGQTGATGSALSTSSRSAEADLDHTNPFIEQDREPDTLGESTNPFVDQPAGPRNPFLPEENTQSESAHYNPFELPPLAPSVPEQTVNGRSAPGDQRGSTRPGRLPNESIGVTGDGSEKRKSRASGHPCQLPDSVAFPMFALWANEPSRHSEWYLMEWLVSEGFSSLITVFRMIHPSESVELLRHTFCEAAALICQAFGEGFTVGAIVPLFTHAIGSPPLGPSAEHILQVAKQLTPMQGHGMHVARTTLLPVFLGGVLPCAGQDALMQYFNLILDQASAPPGNFQGVGQSVKEAPTCWAIMHREDLVTVLMFVASIVDMQMELLRCTHQLTASESPCLRQGAALVGLALSCNLDANAVERRLVPALTRLTEDKNRKVRLEVVNAISEVSRRHCPEVPSLMAKVSVLLDTLMMEGGPQHDVQMAVLASLAEGVPVATAQQLEFLLQKILWLLSSIAQRQTCGKPPTQLTETVEVVFDCLRAVDNCDEQLQQHHNVQLHMVSALTCLQRETELLDISRRELLAAMSRDHMASTPAMDFPGEAPVLQSFPGSDASTVVTVSGPKADQ